MCACTNQVKRSWSFKEGTCGIGIFPSMGIEQLERKTYQSEEGRSNQDSPTQVLFSGDSSPEKKIGERCSDFNTAKCVRDEEKDLEVEQISSKYSHCFMKSLSFPGELPAVDTPNSPLLINQKQPRKLKNGETDLISCVAGKNILEIKAVTQKGNNSKLVNGEVKEDCLTVSKLEKQKFKLANGHQLGASSPKCVSKDSFYLESDRGEDVPVIQMKKRNCPDSPSLDMDDDLDLPPLILSDGEDALNNYLHGKGTVNYFTGLGDGNENPEWCNKNKGKISTRRPKHPVKRSSMNKIHVDESVPGNLVLSAQSTCFCDTMENGDSSSSRVMSVVRRAADAFLRLRKGKKTEVESMICGKKKLRSSFRSPRILPVVGTDAGENDDETSCVSKVKVFDMSLFQGDTEKQICHKAVTPSGEMQTNTDDIVCGKGASETSSPDTPALESGTISKSKKRRRKSARSPRILPLLDLVSHNSNIEPIAAVYKVSQNEIPISGNNMTKDPEEVEDTVCKMCQRGQLTETDKKWPSRLQKELEEARKEAQQEMQEELAKTRKEAEKELNKQKHGYEDRLAELEKALYEQKTGKAQAERDHLMAKGVIDRLEEQKRLLESEVISNKRRQEMEEAAKQKPVEPLPMERCKILDELEKEKKKITEEVQRLVAIRQEREVPTALFTKPRVEVQSGRVDLYRVALLLREANKIAQFLKKNTVFNREDITKDGENQILVKVSNKKLSISTFWTLQKFEAKLVQMRELYQGESESAAEDVFYDPNDCWEKDTRLNSTSDSPRVLDCLNTSMRQRMSSRDSIRQSLASFSGNTSLLNTTLRSVSASSAKSSSTSSVDPLLNPPPPTTLAVIRDFISMDMEKLQDWSVVETHPDKILRDCDCLKVAVATLLEAYNKLSESEDISKDDFVKSEVACLSSIQIKSAMDRLVATSTMWFAMYQQIGSSLIQETTKRMMTLIRSLGNNMVLFLQGCEFDIDTMVQQSSAQILEVIFSICKLCGELSLATDTSLVTLTDYEERSGDLEEEPTSENKLGHDIRQVFLTGCDVFLDKTIQGGLRSLEECEINVQTLAENQNTNQQLSGDILKHVEIVAASAKILLQKGQEVQVELDSTLRESVNNKAENFYHLSYKRSQKLIANVSSLVDGVSLMVQATDALAKGSDGDLRKIQRIADLIQKSTNRLVACSSSTAESPASAMTDNQSETSDFSVLSDSQNEQMEIAAQEVKLATSALADYIQKTLKNDTSFGTPSKVKRMLPVSPEKLVRPSSSPNLQNKTAYIRKNLSLVDMNK
ncbi:uncharacterized protein LOC106174479 isoform X3 [Lingula anatina]|uniref:Uncharacterized protein LOC106174479 isoform X3 n=1 Tax=Lingula anatina TaxID=7574 RepID=A0A1S3JMA0_LINAN|nr:uncharacterized protein LOC106174479 isoform X3 [Lingula anatina]|eukprot:XP_013411513.1 uncharacterized protein LOC106174479 isoform X3 [Lingula anatina]